jgi:hypothetical protein
MSSDPLAQVLPDKTDALIVAVPGLEPKVARPIVVVEKLATVVSLDVQVAEAVTSWPLRLAVNWFWVPWVKVVLEGPIVRVWPPVPPVDVPEIDPLTPPCVAVTVTFEAAPVPTTNPVEFTVTQALELSQVDERVTSFVPLSKVAVAFNCTLGGTEKVLAPD